MEPSQTMQIRIKDILALIVRYAKPIIIFTIICAILFGCYAGYKGYSDVYVVSDSDYYRELSEYNAQKKTINLQIEQTQQLIDSERQYVSDSLLMQIDPNNEYVTNVYAAISGIDTSSVGKMIASGDVAESYLANRIASLYGAYWETIDLNEALKTSSFENYSNKYLREVVEFSSEETGVLAISVIGSDPDETESLANAMFNVLLNYKDTVATNSYDHSLNLIGSSTKTVIDKELNDIQQNHYTLISDNVKVLEGQKSSLSALNAPDSIGKNIVKFVLIGFVLGAFISICWVVISNFLGDYVLSAQQLRDNANIDCIGSTCSAGKSLLAKAAGNISGDPYFASSQDALVYIQESAKSRLQSAKNVLLISTLDISHSNDEIAGIIGNLEKAGYSVEFVGNANNNPKLFAGISDCDKAIFVESVCKTKLSNVLEIQNRVDFAEKTVAGVVLV